MFFVPLIVCFFFFNFHVDKSHLKNKMMKDSAPSPPMNVDFYDMLFSHRGNFHSDHALLPLLLYCLSSPTHRRVEPENNQNIENIEKLNLEGCKKQKTKIWKTWKPKEKVKGLVSWLVGKYM